MPIVPYISSLLDFDFRATAWLFSDMNAAGDWSNYATGGTNSFIVAALNTDGNRVGILDSGTSTSATAHAGIGSATADSVVLGTREHRLQVIAKIPTLSTALQAFTVTIGFHDTRTAALPTDGVYFQYIHSAASGNWTAMSYSNAGSLTSATDTGVAADTNFHTFEIVINADASKAQYFIDGVLRATRSTATDAIPNGSARATAVSVTILKSVGTTARSLYTDLVSLEIAVQR